MPLVFAAAILLSAGLMFIVEPMFAKMVLPLLGGSPAVWNTCLVFYQAVLMGGYIYAHLSLKWLGPRPQTVLHLALLCCAWIGIPIGVANGWTPPGGGNPVGWLLLLLTFCVGLPFFCISASAPVLQAWFAHCGGRWAKDPYFLYAASNLGSLLGLAAYPLLIEPRMPLNWQTRSWAAGYGLLIALFAICAVAVWMAGRRTSATMPAEPSTDDMIEVTVEGENEGLPSGFDAPVTLLRRLWWLCLAAVPSALLMGVTSHLSVDIASGPLLWAIPLGLYLLSFIIVFARWPIGSWLWLLRIFQVAALIGAAGTVWLSWMNTGKVLEVGVLHLAAFFLTALVCHGAMATDRPASKYLTEFYLWMSAGGVVGGLACALVAPVVFKSVLEYPLMLAAACLLGPPRRSWRHERLWLFSDLALSMMQVGIFVFVLFAIPHGRLAAKAADWNSLPLKRFAQDITSDHAKFYWVVAAGVLAFLLQRSRIGLTVAVALFLGVSLICNERGDVKYSDRSFFGVLRVEVDHYYNSDWEDKDDQSYVCHTLMHGSTMHGQQSHDDRRPDDARDPWTYYDPSGPIGNIFDALEAREQFLHHGHIGVVGLGTGTLAAYAKPGQSLTYFEIDKAVCEIAKNPDYFTYLSNCKVKPEICMGDARLTLARMPDGQFDVLFIDAFSSDAIPIHLLTREAVEMYRSKLAPNGLLVVHLSNRHLRLEPVVVGVADSVGLVARLRDDEDESNIGKTSSTWAVLTRVEKDLGQLNDNKDWETLLRDPKVPVWTDDYSSIVSVMNWDWLDDWKKSWLPKWLRAEKPAN
jgi:hypothetical protein